MWVYVLDVRLLHISFSYVLLNVLYYYSSYELCLEIFLLKQDVLHVCTDIFLQEKKKLH